MFPREGPIVSSKKMIRLWWLTLKFLAEHPNWLVSVHTCHHASSVALQSKPERCKQDHFHKHVYKVLTKFTIKSLVRIQLHCAHMLFSQLLIKWKQVRFPKVH